MTATDQRAIVHALEAADREAGGEPGLKRMAEHLGAVRFGSVAFARLVAATDSVLPRYFRGSYGAKLALIGGGDSLLLSHPGTEAAIAAYFRERDAATPQRLAELVKNAHPRRRPEPLHCRDCHVESGSKIDFAALGYPQPRIQKLFQPEIFRMIEHIQEGREFRIPTLNGATSLTGREGG